MFIQTIAHQFVKSVFQSVGTPTAVWYAKNPVITAATRPLLESKGAEIGQNTRIKRSFHIDNSILDENSTGDFTHLTVGDDCYLGDRVYVDLADEIDIGDNVTIAGEASFVTHADCNRSPYLNEQFPREQAPITIEDGAWVGFGATIMPGVTVASESVVAAGAVLRTDTEPRTIYGGVPATKLREVED